jgi:hypothetical protein
MARKHIEPFVDRDVPFRKMTLPGFKKGMSYKMLSIDEDTGACSMTVKFDKGYRLPPGMSYTEYEMQVLTGSIKYGDQVVTAGYYLRVPAGVHMPEMYVPRGATAMLMYNFAEPSFVESDEDHPLAFRDQLTIVDSYDGLQWMGGNGGMIYPAVAPGCLLKVLKYDPLTEALTFLYSMTPRFWQDNISYHDCAEEGYHIWGDSFMMQFGNLPTGGYFWRPPWINHGSFSSELGILGFGRTDSKLHNYFHWNPWTSPEENRDRAAAQLARTRPDLFNWAISEDGHNHPHDFEAPDWKEDSEYI